MLDRNDSTQNLYDLSITEAKQGTKGMKKSFYIEIRDDRLYHIRQSSAVKWEKVEASEQKIGELFEKHGIDRWASLHFKCELEQLKDFKRTVNPLRSKRNRRRPKLAKEGAEISKTNKLNKKSKDNKSKDTEQISKNKSGYSKTAWGVGAAATAAVVAGLYYFWPSSNEGNGLGSQSPTIYARSVFCTLFSLFGGYKLYNYFTGSKAEADSVTRDASVDAFEKEGGSSRKSAKSPKRKEESSKTSCLLLVVSIVVIVAVVVYLNSSSQSEERRDTIHPAEDMV